LDKQLEQMNRNALLEAWAEVILAGKDKVPAAESTKSFGYDVEVEKQRLQLDRDRFNWEQQKTEYEMTMSRQEQEEAKKELTMRFHCVG
jgi:hypothetical protein